MEMLIPLLGLTLLLFVLFRNKDVRGRATTTTAAPPPPGPWKLPIIGNLHQLMMSPHGTHYRLRELAQKYGPVMQLRFGEVTNVIISSPEAAKQVMKTHDLVFASRPTEMLAPSIIFYGRQDVAFAPYGEHWRQMRKICIVELLSAKRVSWFRSIREQEVSNLVARLSQCSEDREGVDMRRVFTSLTSNVTSKAAFGTMEKEREAFVGLVDKIIEAHEGLGLSDLFPSLKFLPTVTGFRRKLESIHRAADSILEEIINQHRDKRRRRRRSEEAQQGHVETEDIVDILLNLQETGDLSLPLTDDIIKAVVFDMFIGGIETSSSTIEWTMSEIVKNPRVLELAQAEVRRVFGTKGKVDEDGLHELTYLNAIIKESLRMHPNGPLALPRESLASATVNGFELPAKTRVLVHVWAIGRDPSYWTDPDVFRPERFLDSSVDYKGTHFEFVPFGAGRRICPGMLFGLAIVHLTLANLLFHFDWKLPTGIAELEDLDMTEHFGISLTKKQILRLVPVSHAR